MSGKVISYMHIWTRKSLLNFVSLIQSPHADSRSGLDWISLGGDLGSANALVV